MPGEDIRLTIDAGLQLALEQEVMAARIANGAQAVSAVVLDPWTGEIYAEATYPSYDANDYATIATEDPSRFLDPVVSGVYEPGSVFKMMTVLAALEQGTTSMSRTYRDSGRLRLDDGQARIEDADGKAMGKMTLEDAIAYSRNVVAAKVALGLAPTTQGASEILHETWTRLGFGSPTGIDVAGEVRGLVNDPATTPWRQIDLANGSFGQGVAIHQIQLATAYAALVNGGILVTPHVVAGVGAEPVDASVDAPVLDPQLSPQLAGLMEHVLRARGTRSTPGPRLLGRRQDRHRAGLGRGASALGAESLQLLVRRVHRPARGHPTSSCGPHPGSPPRSQRAGELILPVVSTELFRRVATGRGHHPGPAAGPPAGGSGRRTGRPVTGVGATLSAVTVEGPPPSAGAHSRASDAPALTADDLRRLTGGLLREPPPDPGRRGGLPPRRRRPAVRGPAR